MAVLLAILCLAGLCYCGYRFYNSYTKKDVPEMILWGVLILFISG